MEGSLWLEVVRASLPEVPLDKGVAQANTGSLLLDSLPLLTMAPAAKASAAASNTRCAQPPLLPLLAA